MHIIETKKEALDKMSSGRLKYPPLNKADDPTSESDMEPAVPNKKSSTSAPKKREFKSPKKDHSDFIKSKLKRLERNKFTAETVNPVSHNSSDDENSGQEIDDNADYIKQKPIKSTSTKINSEISPNKKRKINNNKDSDDSLDDELSENLKLKEEVAKLKTEVKEKDKEIADLIRRNAGLQDKMLSRLDDLNKNVEDIEKEAANAAGQETLIKVGAMKGDKIHLGRNVWLKKTKYDFVLVTAKTPQMYINSLAEATYGFRTLINSSVTGKVSNTRIKKFNSTARPRLNPQILCAIQDSFEKWAQSCTPPYDSVKIQFFRNEVPSVISKFITKLRSRHCRKNLPLDSSEKSSNEATSPSTSNVVSDGTSTSDSHDEQTRYNSDVGDEDLPVIDLDEDSRGNDRVEMNENDTKLQDKENVAKLQDEESAED